MAEFSIPTALDCPAGTLTFNGSAAPTYYLTNVSGNDGAALRAAVDDLPAYDGALIRDAYRTAVYPVLEGLILDGGVFSSRRNLSDALLGYTDTLLRGNGTLRWTPSGATERYRTVRLFQPVVIATGPAAIIKSFQLGLVAGDPLAYTNTLRTVTSGALASGTVDVTATNNGYVPTPPVLRVYGQITNPLVTNQTTGEHLTYTGTIAAGAFVDFDSQNETATSSTGANVIGNLGTSSVFFYLGTGVTVVRLTGTSPNGVEKVRVQSRDAWVG